MLEEAVEAGPRKEPMESSKKLLLLPLTLALLVGCILLDNGLLEEKRQYNFVSTAHCTEVRFASFLSDGFTMAVINPPERKLVKCISV